MPMRKRITRGARAPYGTLVAAATAAARDPRHPGRRPDGPAAPAAGSVRESRPVHSYADAVRESVWVDTGLDGDGDGRADRVAVDVVRPGNPPRPAAGSR